jgi:hypothetical protein
MIPANNTPKVIAEYTSGAAASNPTKEYIYSGGLLASVEGLGCLSLGSRYVNR